MITNKPLYEFIYTKNDRFGFNEEQDMKILRELYPEVQHIELIYSMPGEVHFMLIN